MIRGQDAAAERPWQQIDSRLPHTARPPLPPRARLFGGEGGDGVLLSQEVGWGEGEKPSLRSH